jgi:SPP1 family predicted phage head-tail adaptor
VTQAGELRHRISIQRRTDTMDAFGESVPTWSDLIRRYPARVRDDTQREFTANFQVQSDKTTHITIRDPRQAITPKERVVWHTPSADRIYDIKAVLAGENAGTEVTLVCIEHS